MKDKSNKQPISSLYLLKGICAFLVVCCHAPWAGELNHWIIPLRWSAVPFFFTITGYFLYHEDRDTIIKNIKTTLIKLLPIILLTNLFYLLWLFPNHGWTLNKLQQCLDLIFYGDSIMGPLWYLVALAWGVVFFYCILRVFFRNSILQNRFIQLLIALLPLSLLSTLALGWGDTLYEYFNIKYSPFNALCYALPYLSLGFLIKKNEEYLCTLPFNLYALFSFLIIYIEFIISSLYLKSEFDSTCFSTTLFVFCTFIFLLQHKHWGSQSKLAHIGKVYSGNIYYWHMAALTIGAKLTALIGITASTYNLFAAPAGFVIGLGMSVVVVAIQNKLNIHIFR